MANKAAFTIAIGLTKAYTLAISGFTAALTWVMRLQEHINISFSPTIGMKVTWALAVKRIRMTISKMSLTGKLVTALSLKKIRMVSTIKTREKLVTALSAKKIIITAYTKARDKFLATIAVKKIAIVFSPVIALFYTLGYYASDTLGTLDTDTLGTLDYTI